MLKHKVLLTAAAIAAAPIPGYAQTINRGRLDQIPPASPSAAAAGGAAAARGRYPSLERRDRRFKFRMVCLRHRGRHLNPCV